MRPPHPHLIRIGTAVAALAAVAACGSDGQGNDDVTATAGTSGAQIEIGNTINYGSFGTTAEIDCADGKSLNIAGSNNTLTVIGACTNVDIGGADNKIGFERIDDELSVIGINNTVTYSDGDPKVSNTGSNNTITKG
ncbi:DUF3060 domain-containing protein [Mycobacterium sp. Y57]|uniref:DUF3060 domain-containing protein n=1 Tax=Mycolicibacterium xanthum TaxID=2796469 RepID=UPI001C850F98|nr:DUF3060 domain-containing protein [Mycolicibacterium xanthum]MBX7432291.1 DUF3060 domain-containing protein [Mycolicibacterium xanthum]